MLGLIITKKLHSIDSFRILKLSPRPLIQERILLVAKRYLAFSNVSVAEIGYIIGFEDANYFIRFFRLHENKTPAQFRKQNNLEYAKIQSDKN